MVRVIRYKTRNIYISVFVCLDACMFVFVTGNNEFTTLGVGAEKRSHLNS